MIINKLKVKNFRQYYDQSIIDFANNPEKSFTIIQGTNGAGKTTLLNAITWCLYGDELHNVTDDPIYNEVIENETEPGGNFPVEVEIEMINKKNELITFKRRMRYYKAENGKVFDSMYDDDDFSIVREKSKDNKPS